MKHALVGCVVLAGCGRLGFDGIAGPVSLSYPEPEVLGVLGKTAVELVPATTGDDLRFTVEPALPGGLALGETTGVISGTPAQPIDDAAFTITAANAEGAARAEVRLLILPGSLVDAVDDAPDDDGGADASCFATPAGGCTLRAAVETANRRTSKQLVLLDARTYPLAATLGDVTNDVIIAGRGAAATTVRATTIHPGYGMITGATGHTLGLRRATFRDFGSADGAVVHIGAGTLDVDLAAFANNTAGSGGVFFIHEGASAVIARSTFTANSASGGNGWGGVINGEDDRTAIVVRQCTASENTAPWGSFSHITSGTRLTLENSTLYRNTASIAGALATPGGRYTLINDTIVFNTNTGTDSAAIFLYSPPSAYTVANTIVAFNRDGAGDEHNCNHRVADTPITSLGGNILSDDGGNCALEFAASGDRLATDPGIDPEGLADHGGPTRTIKLVDGSIAIDGAQRCPRNDQRGVLRPEAPERCDIGAVELP